jgi:hypothetical protein
MHYVHGSLGKSEDRHARAAWEKLLLALVHLDFDERVVAQYGRVPISCTGA